MLMTADDVLADLGDAAYDVVERVPGRAPCGGARTAPTRTAYDALVRVVRTV